MSSILISWRGQCPERDRRQHLIVHLRELAEIALERFDERYDRYDHEITGQIFLHREVFYDRRVPPALRPHPADPDFFLLERARLYGIDFRLPTIYGGRADNNRVTFVFLCADDDPELDGYLVRVNGAQQCREGDHPILHTADWLLTAPRIHLRRTFEDWTKELLAWVRAAYMPDLRYSDFDDESHWLEEAPTLGTQAREGHFQRLKNIKP